jgi:hypothetical protein
MTRLDWMGTDKFPSQGVSPPRGPAIASRHGSQSGGDRADATASVRRLPRHPPDATEDTYMTDPPRSQDIGVEPDRGEGMPRWVKVSGIIVIILVLLVVVMLLVGGGGHGPRRHALSADPSGTGSGGITPWDMR